MPGSALASAFASLRAGGGSRSLPWARPRYELALLALVATVALIPLPGANPQDISRTCLANALIHGSVSADRCLEASVDYAVRDGHRYSDKAPGLSIIEIPVVAIVQPLPFRDGWDWRIWLVRASSVGAALLACAFLLGRVAEGLQPGVGPLAIVLLGLGTLTGALAQVSFEHVPAALAVFGTFVLAWRNRPLAAGLAAGSSLLIEYESGVAVAVIAAYVLLAGARQLARYLVGTIPGVIVLGAYNWAAFGAPWHLSYHYVAAAFSGSQSQGLFGISAPSLSGLAAVIAGNGGLLFVSPVLALSAYGLVRLARHHAAEALVAAALLAALVLANTGYFLPYGGASPGPRFIAPALPFVLLGLAEAYITRPRLTVLLAVMSGATATAVALTWTQGTIVMRNTVWAELARAPFAGSSGRLARAIPPSIFGASSLARWLEAIVVVAGAAVALTIAVRALPPRVIVASTSPTRPRLVGAAAVVALLVAIDAGAVLGYPSGNGYQPRRSPLNVAVSGSPASSYPGGEVNYRVDVTNESDAVLLPDVTLTLTLASGMHLVGAPKLLTGHGCTGDTVVRCRLDYLAPRQPTTVWFGIQFSEPGIHRLLAQASSNGFAGPPATPFDVPVGN